VKIDVQHNQEKSRYELLVNGSLTGIADYRAEGDTLVFPHTEIEPRMQGQGLGEKLVRSALDDVRRRNAKVVPLCWFVREFIDDNPEYADLKAS
jgi:predicted GNAT family acetyltransferase